MGVEDVRNTDGAVGTSNGDPQRCRDVPGSLDASKDVRERERRSCEESVRSRDFLGRR